jgi:hypothetical protein
VMGVEAQRGRAMCESRESEWWGSESQRGVWRRAKKGKRGKVPFGPGTGSEAVEAPELEFFYRRGVHG